MAYTVNTSAAALNRAFNNANATPTAFAATAAELTADKIAAANKFDVATLTDLALSTQVLTNMGILPSTVTEVKALEAALADYFAGPGKGNRGFVVLQLAEILSDFPATDVFYGAAATAWNAEVAASVADATPGTFALTTSTTDNLVGSSGDDTFTGSLAGLASALSLNVTDKIDGGAGNDTLNVSMNVAFGGFTTGSMTGVETVGLTNGGSSSLEFDASGATGVTAYTLNSATGAITLKDVGTGLKTISINGLAKADAITTFTSAFATGAAETTATSDALALNLNGVGTSSTYYADLTLGGYNTVNANVTGTNAVQFNGTEMTKLNVAGSGKTTVLLASTATALTSFDASAASGGVTATLTAVGANGQLKTVATGTGTDAITIEAQDLPANGTLTDAGGTDTLTVRSNGGTIEWNQSGFETLAFTGVSSALTVSGAKTSGVTTVSTNYSTSSSSNTNAKITLVNMGAGALAFDTKGAVAAGDVDSDHTGATTLNYKAAATTSAAYGSDNATADYSFGETSALTVNAGAYTTTTGSTIGAAKAASVTINTTSGLDLAGAEKTLFNSVVTAQKAKSFAVDSKGNLGSAAQISAADATSGTVSYSGLDNGSLIISAGKLKSLTVTTGNDLDLDTSASIGALETLTVDAQRGLTNFGDLAKINSITLSGAGTVTDDQSRVDLGALGGTTTSNVNAYDISLTATGLKGASGNNGLNVGTINVAAGYDISVDVSGTTGNVNIGAIGGVVGGDDVTINAKKAAGNFTVADVVGKGNVSILASGTTGTVTVNAVTGKAVTVDVSGTGSTTSDVGTITAKTSASVNYNTLKANTSKAINLDAASTAFTATVNGGILQDTVTITGSAVQTSITVGGDFGATTTDKITINSLLAAAATAQTIDISGLANYDESAITSGASDDTISGGAGKDTILAGRGQDTLTGGAGVDTFVFNTGDSNYDKFDTITDLAKTDQIVFGHGNIDATYAAAVTGSSTSAAISTGGIATFADTSTSGKDTLAEVVALVNKAITTGSTGNAAMFDFGGTTYLFIDTDAAATQDTTGIVVKLTGVVIAAVSLTDAVTAGTTATATGLTGFAA